MNPIPAPTPPDTRKMLVLTTAHLRLKTAKTWNKATGDFTEGGFPMPYGYGVIVAGSDEHDSEASPEVVAAMRLARSHGCHMLRYDCDGDTYTELETFDW